MPAVAWVLWVKQGELQGEQAQRAHSALAPTLAGTAVKALLGFEGRFAL